METKSKILKEKIFTIKVIEYENGKTFMERKADGFDAYELLGVITLTQQEVIKQIQGEFKPDFVKREYVVD